MISDDVAVDLTHRPGQQVIAQMVDILAVFRGPGALAFAPCVDGYREPVAA